MQVLWVGVAWAEAFTSHAFLNHCLKMNKGTYKKIMIAGIIIAVLSIVVGWFGFPALVNMKIGKVPSAPTQRVQ